MEMSNSNSRKGVFARLKNAVSESVSTSMERMKCCGQKRRHPTVTMFTSKHSIMKDVVITPQPPTYNQKPPLVMNQQCPSDNNEETTSSRLLIESDFQDSKYASQNEMEGLLMKRLKVQEDHGLEQSCQNDNIEYMFNQQENTPNEAEFNIPDHMSHCINSHESKLNQEDRNLNLIEEIIQSKQKEIEQLKQIKDQCRLQSQVNQIEINSQQFNNSFHQATNMNSNQPREFLRGPRFGFNRPASANRFLNRSMNFDQPAIKPNHSFYQNFSNLNNSFDTFNSKQHEFLQPILPFKRHELSSQTKVTSDSFLDDALHLTNQIKVSRFSAQQQKQNQFESMQRRPEFLSRSMQKNQEIKTPTEQQVNQLKLPRLGYRDILYVKNEVLSSSKIGLSSNEDISYLISDELKIQRNDLKKLCQTHEAIDPHLITCYLQVMKQICSKNCQIFDRQELDLNKEEWQKLVQSLCYQDPKKADCLIFASFPKSSTDFLNQEMMLYIMENHTLKIVKFEQTESSLYDESPNTQFYTSRLRELQKSLYNARCNIGGNSSIFSRSLNLNTQMQVEQLDIKVYEGQETGLCTLIYIFYLRFVVQTLLGEYLGTYKQWLETEELIKQPDLNEYWRFSIALELLHKEVLE